VGGMLASLGFTSKYRTNSGWVLRLDTATHDRAHQLLKTHGIGHLQAGELERYAKNCQACQALISPSRSITASGDGAGSTAP
jgi:hypothetical protein